MHLFPTNAKAGDWNWTRLHALGSSIALVRAEHTIGEYANVSADCFRSLEPHLYLVVGVDFFGAD